MQTLTMPRAITLGEMTDGREYLMRRPAPALIVDALTDGRELQWDEMLKKELRADPTLTVREAEALHSNFWQAMAEIDRNNLFGDVAPLPADVKARTDQVREERNQSAPIRDAPDELLISEFYAGHLVKISGPEAQDMGLNTQRWVWFEEGQEATLVSNALLALAIGAAVVWVIHQPWWPFHR